MTVYRLNDKPTKLECVDSRQFVGVTAERFAELTKGVLGTTADPDVTFDPMTAAFGDPLFYAERLAFETVELIQDFYLSDGLATLTPTQVEDIGKCIGALHTVRARLDLIVRARCHQDRAKQTPPDVHP